MPTTAPMPTVENRLLQSEAKLKRLRVTHRRERDDFRKLTAAAKKAARTMRDMAYQTAAWEELANKANAQLAATIVLVEVLLDDDAPNTRLEELVAARKALRALVAKTQKRKRRRT